MYRRVRICTIGTSENISQQIEVVCSKATTVAGAASAEPLMTADGDAPPINRVVRLKIYPNEKYKVGANDGNVTLCRRLPRALGVPAKELSITSSSSLNRLPGLSPKARPAKCASESTKKLDQLVKIHTTSRSYVQRAHFVHGMPKMPPNVQTAASDGFVGFLLPDSDPDTLLSTSFAPAAATSRPLDDRTSVSAARCEAHQLAQQSARWLDKGVTTLFQDVARRQADAADRQAAFETALVGKDVCQQGQARARARQRTSLAWSRCKRPWQRLS